MMRLAAGVAALGLAGAAGAQETPTTLPDLGNYSLPGQLTTPPVWPWQRRWKANFGALTWRLEIQMMVFLSSKPPSQVWLKFQTW